MYYAPMWRRAWIVMLAAAVLHLVPDGSPIGGDEFFTWWAVQQPVDEIVRIAAGDVHPPVYFLLAALWERLFGHSLVSLRLFSGFISLAAIAALWHFLDMVLRDETNTWRWYDAWGPHVVKYELNTAAVPTDDTTGMPTEFTNTLVNASTFAHADVAGGAVILTGAGADGLRLTVEADSFASLEAAVAALRAAGLTVEVPQSSSGEAGRTRAVLRLAAG